MSCVMLPEASAQPLKITDQDQVSDINAFIRESCGREACILSLADPSTQPRLGRYS